MSGSDSENETDDDDKEGMVGEEEEADVSDMEDMIDEIVERERLTSLASSQPNTIEIDVPLIDTLNLPVPNPHDVCELAFNVRPIAMHTCICNLLFAREKFMPLSSKTAN